MPIDYSKYPANWKSEIVPRILKRSNNHCEFCFVRNKDYVHSYEIGNRRVWASEEKDQLRLTMAKFKYKIVRVILTVAHLDHNENNYDVDDSRLASLCQYCHLNYDAKEKAKRISKKGK